LNKTVSFLLGLLPSFIIVLAFSIPHLNLPHFWDEAWVYAPAVKWMATNNISILPDAAPLFISRGHPLLFQFLGSVWLSIFGIDNFGAHTYALFISLTTLFVSFWFVRKHFGVHAAAFSTLLLSTSAFFLTQSAMVYPEMLLTLGLIISLFGFVEKKNWLFYLGSFIAIYAKETALVFVVGFILWDAYQIIFHRRAYLLLLRHLVPILIFISHPLLCYFSFGWFFNPEHTGLINWDLSAFTSNLKNVFRFVFEKQFRGWVFYPIIGLAALLLPLKSKGWNFLMMAIGFTAYKILMKKWVVPDLLYPVILVVFCALPLLLWHLKRRDRENTAKQDLIGLMFTISVGYIVFSALNFYTPRYTLAIVTILSLGTMILLWSSTIHVRLKWIVSIACMTLGMYNTFTQKTISEVNLGLHNDLMVQQKMVDYIVENHRNDSYCANFVTRTYMANHFAGYVAYDDQLLNDYLPFCKDDCNMDLLIFTGTEGYCPPVDQDLSAFTLVYSDTLGASFARVYKRTKS